MTAPITSPSPTQPDTMQRVRDAICMLLMPFFMLGAGDDPDKARAAVGDLIQAYKPADTLQLDIVARIIGFSTAALDNLRLSMTSDTLSDAKILRYRSAAVSLSRSAEQCRVVLGKMQSAPPDIKAAQPPIQRPVEPPIQPAIQREAPAAKPRMPLPPMNTTQLEKAKAEARTLLAGLAKLGATPGQGLTALHVQPDPAARISLAVADAIARKQGQDATLDPQKGRRAV